MKRWMVVLFLALFPVSLVAEDAWPGKGDTVYISASFKQLSATSPVPGTTMKYDIPPCAKFTVVKASPEKSRWVARDAMRSKLPLQGDWTPHFHKDKAACEAYVSLAGEGKTIRTGGAYKILPAPPR